MITSPTTADCHRLPKWSTYRGFGPLYPFRQQMPNPLDCCPPVYGEKIYYSWNWDGDTCCELMSTTNWCWFSYRPDFMWRFLIQEHIPKEEPVTLKNTVSILVWSWLPPLIVITFKMRVKSFVSCDIHFKNPKMAIIISQKFDNGILLLPYCDFITTRLHRNIVGRLARLHDPTRQTRWIVSNRRFSHP